MIPAHSAGGWWCAEQRSLRVALMRSRLWHLGSSQRGIEAGETPEMAAVREIRKK